MSELKTNKLPGRKHVSYLITGVIGGLILGYLLFDNQTALAPIGNPKEQSANSKVFDQKNRGPIVTDIIVATQIPGDVILVQKLTMNQDGWIAVHDDQNGQPGRILGANYLPAGSYQNQMVSLLRGITDGGSYFAIIHDDNGDKIFDYKTDLPRKNTAGQIQLANFKVVAESPRGD